MADAAAQAGDAKAGTKGGRSGRRARILFWTLGLATGIALGVALPTGIMLVVGLLPAAAAFATDIHPEKTTAKPVLCLNLAGLLPALKMLWLGGHDMRALAAVLGDPTTLVLAYGGAAFGFALARTLPYAVLVALEAKAATTMKLLAQRQDQLRADWGDAVAEEANRMAMRAAKAIERKVADR
jgi:acyl-CoA synthetase (AMP-forming)/AMP-acid ligase II